MSEPIRATQTTEMTATVAAVSSDRDEAREKDLAFSRADLAKAWAEGFKQGGPMHDEHYGEPDRHKRNPYSDEATS